MKSAKKHWPDKQLIFLFGSGEISSPATPNNSDKKIVPQEQVPTTISQEVVKNTLDDHNDEMANMYGRKPKHH